MTDITEKEMREKLHNIVATASYAAQVLNPAANQLKDMLEEFASNLEKCILPTMNNFQQILGTQPLISLLKEEELRTRYPRRGSRSKKYRKFCVRK